MAAYEVDWRRWLREHRQILEAQLNLLDGRGAKLGSRHANPLFRDSAREIVAEWIHELDDLIGSDDALASAASPTQSARPPARSEAVNDSRREADEVSALRARGRRDHLEGGRRDRNARHG
jgi:hypothetical protein